MEIVKDILNHIFAGLTITRAVTIISVLLLLDFLSYKFKIKFVKNFVLNFISKIIVVILILYTFDTFADVRSEYNEFKNIVDNIQRETQVSTPVVIKQILLLAITSISGNYIHDKSNLTERMDKIFKEFYDFYINFNKKFCFSQAYPLSAGIGCTELTQYEKDKFEKQLSQINNMIEKQSPEEFNRLKTEVKKLQQRISNQENDRNQTVKICCHSDGNCYNLCGNKWPFTTLTRNDKCDINDGLRYNVIWVSGYQLVSRYNYLIK